MSDQITLPGPRELFPDIFGRSPSANTSTQVPSSRNVIVNPSSNHVAITSATVVSTPSSSLPNLQGRASSSSTTPVLRPAVWPSENAAHTNASPVPAGEGGRRRNYACTICNKFFTRPSSLETHMNSHTGARPHVCPFPGCLRDFSVRSNMRRHHRSHFMPEDYPGSSSHLGSSTDPFPYNPAYDSASSA